MQNEKFFCPCPWFDGTPEGCHGCNEILECEVYPVVWQRFVDSQSDDDAEERIKLYFDGKIPF